MRRDRTSITLMLGVVLVLLAGVVRPKDTSICHLGSEKRFWAIKTHSGAQFDMVVIGDSRVLLAISPEAMQSVLPGYHVLNFGYSGGGLNNTMYTEAAQKLNPDSHSKVIVLGVTPRTLTQYAAQNEKWLQEKERPLGDVMAEIYFSPLVDRIDFFIPMTSRDIQAIIRRTAPTASCLHYREYSDSGWIGSWSVESDAATELLVYQAIFAENQVSQQLVQNLVDQTKIWKDQNIQVFAFRPPTTLEMEALENELSGFDEASFVEQFEAAGGIWLSFSPDNYEVYDGSHLSKQSAIQFSQDLAEQIGSHLDE